MEKDVLGIVSNKHIMLANEKGVENDTVKDLSLKCAVAVDFAKHG